MTARGSVRQALEVVDRKNVYAFERQQPLRLGIRVTATTKVQKKIICDFITGDGRKKAEGWLLRYMEFPFKAYTKVGGGRLTENTARIKSLIS